MVTEPREPHNLDGPAEAASRKRFSLEELADLDAGLLTDDEEQQLRGRIVNDPAATEPLDELRQVRTILGELRNTEDEPIPDDVAARIAAALAAEAVSAGTDPQSTPTSLRTEPTGEEQPTARIQH